MNADEIVKLRQLHEDYIHVIDTFNYGITWLAYRTKPERSEG